MDPATGKLLEGIEAQAERALTNLEAVLAAAGMTTADVIKTSVFLSDLANFGAMNAIYASHFSAPAPARSTFQVAALPLGRADRDRSPRRPKSEASTATPGDSALRARSDRHRQASAARSFVLPSHAMSNRSDAILPVILAAGAGTRMKSRKPKVLHELCGRPMLAYVMDAAAEVSVRRPLVVYSPATEEITGLFADRADFALQATPLGTADAVRAAMAVASPEVAEVVVLSGDVPLVQPDVLADLVDVRRARNAAMAIVAVHTAEPAGLGRVVRSEDGGQVLRVVEEPDASPAELEIEEINAGVYAFDAAWLRPASAT